MDTKVNSFEAGYELVKYYTKYYWNSGKFRSLARDLTLEDAIQEIMVKMIRSNHFEKFNPEITSFKYHVMHAVNTTMIDMARRQREEAISLDQPIASDEESTITVGDTIKDPKANPFDDVHLEEAYRNLLERLPETNSKVEAESPVFGRCFLGVRMIFAHLALGYKVPEIASMFGVSTGRVYQLRKEIEEILAA